MSETMPETLASLGRQPLSQQGLASILARVQASAALTADAVRGLRENPKKTVGNLLELDRTQQAGLAKFDDAWFSEKVAGPIATSLEKGEQVVVTVGPRRRDAETQAFGCGVKVDRTTTTLPNGTTQTTTTVEVEVLIF
ncbi:hypothetical protein [Frankia sp. Cr2]|uniref:hypothetical protein n=1 Tax=Frankia sp. Cr2 TaxID=3073932 RepID=UPI002AD3DC6F|nr:hypothetical protein [Frankia sp. Cr2]